MRFRSCIPNNRPILPKIFSTAAHRHRPTRARIWQIELNRSAKGRALGAGRIEFRQIELNRSAWSRALCAGLSEFQQIELYNFSAVPLFAISVGRSVFGIGRSIPPQFTTCRADSQRRTGSHMMTPDDKRRHFFHFSSPTDQRVTHAMPRVSVHFCFDWSTRHRFGNQQRGPRLGRRPPGKPPPGGNLPCRAGFPTRAPGNPVQNPGFQCEMLAKGGPVPLMMPHAIAL